MREFVVPQHADGLSLAVCAERFVRELSHGTAEVALQIGCVFVNRRRVKHGHLPLRAGDHVALHLGGAFQRAILSSQGRQAPPKTKPRILHEDSEIVVVFKPSGLLSAPTPEGDGNNLKSLLEDEMRHELFVVHRLDLQTSGVLVLAKTPLANRKLSELFRRHQLVRRYDAFVCGAYPRDQDVITVPLGGRRATTQIQIARRFSEVTQLCATLETGRTHQIRLHLLERGTFILGDPRYGKPTPNDPPRLALHARVLVFAHPASGRQMSFDEPLPADLAVWAEALS